MTQVQQLCLGPVPAMSSAEGLEKPPVKQLFVLFCLVWFGLVWFVCLSLVSLFVCLFVCSFVGLFFSFVCSLVRSFVGLFVCSFVVGCWCGCSHIFFGFCCCCCGCCCCCLGVWSLEFLIWGFYLPGTAARMGPCLWQEARLALETALKWWTQEPCLSAA